MANVCAPSLRSIGVGVGGGSVAKCGISADLFLARRSLIPPSLNMRFGKSWDSEMQGRHQLVKHRPVRAGRSGVQAGQVALSRFLAPANRKEVLPTKPPPHQSPGIGSGTLESWVERSLEEIVRHLPEAPFLQCVFNSNPLPGRGERARLSEDLFDEPENWSLVKDRLLESAPDGIILVHRLDPDSQKNCCLSGSCDFGQSSGPPAPSSARVEDDSTVVWGVLVHGRGTRSNACYLLKTTQVTSSFGILTHFSLSRAKCMGPSIQSQLQSVWLL